MVRAGRSVRQATTLRLAVISLVVVAGIASPDGALAQEPGQERAGEPDAGARVAAARRLAEADSIGPAIDTLRAYLADNPEDGGTRWLLARYLDRAGQPGESVTAYEVALARLPGDPWLRLEFARLLLSQGRTERVVRVLQPVLGADTEPAARARALGLAGTAAYWRGDYTTAARRFRAALALDPGREESRRQLDEILAATRPWVSVRASLRDDDQPFRRYRVGLEGGSYLTPLWTLGVGVSPGLLDPSDPDSGQRLDRAAGAGWLEVTGSLPRADLRVRGRLGGWLQDGQSEPASDPGRRRPRGAPSTDEPLAAAWLAEGEVVYRLPWELAIRATASRHRYLATVTSVDTLLMVRSVELAAGRPESHGVAGEVLGRREIYPDGNVVRTAYVWVLVPVLPGVRLGYAGSFQDADESRWRRVDPAAAAARYDPYYTPERVAIHAALAELGAEVGPVGLRVSGRYGFHGTERAPAIDSLGAVEFHDRAFDPWTVRGGLTWASPAGLRVEVAAEHETTAFWAETRLSVATRFRLGRAGLGR